MHTNRSHDDGSKINRTMDVYRFKRDLLIGDVLWGSPETGSPYITPCWTEAVQPVAEIFMVDRV